MNYLGLHEHVRYRIEIGLAYIDDGATVHRLDEGLFEAVRAGVASDLDQSGGQAAQVLLGRLPSVFCTYPEQPAARRSFDAAEIPACLLDE